MSIAFLDDKTVGTANWLYSASGLSRQLGQIQRGPLYIDAVGETKATGFFSPTWDGDLRVDSPIPLITMVTDPSGYHWMSASGVTDFVITFENTPIGDNFTTTPLLVGHWVAAL